MPQRAAVRHRVRLDDAAARRPRVRPRRAAARLPRDTLRALGHIDCGVAMTIVYTWVTPEKKPTDGEDWFGIHSPSGAATVDSRAFTAGCGPQPARGRRSRCAAAAAGEPKMAIAGGGCRHTRARCRRTAASRQLRLHAASLDRQRSLPESRIGGLGHDREVWRRNRNRPAKVKVLPPGMSRLSQV